MSKGGGSQTTTTNTSPWSGQQPYLLDLFRLGQDQYGQGPQQYYQGNLVAPFSPQTQMGMDMGTQRAFGTPYEDAFDSYLTRTMGQRNVSPTAAAGAGWDAMSRIDPAMNMLQSAGNSGLSFGDASQFAGGATNPYEQTLQGVGAGVFGEGYSPSGSPAVGASPATDQLMASARGDFLGSNPYLDDVYNTAANRMGTSFNETVMPALAAQFGTAGRTGSGLHQLYAGRAAGDFATQLRGLAGDIYAPAYESERGRQLQAADALGGLQLQSRGLGVQAAQAGGNLGLGRADLASRLYNAGADRMMNAASQMGNIGLGGLEAYSNLYNTIGDQQFRAASLAPSAQQMDYANIDRMMQIGAMNEDQAQRLIDADISRFDFNQQAPWQNLSNYANLLYGLPGGYGSQTIRQPRQSGSRLAGAMGGGMMGYQMGGPWGGAAGAVLGGLLGG